MKVTWRLRKALAVRLTLAPFDVKNPWVRRRNGQASASPRDPAGQKAHAQYINIKMHCLRCRVAGKPHAESMESVQSGGYWLQQRETGRVRLLRAGAPPAHRCKVSLRVACFFVEPCSMAASKETCSAAANKAPVAAGARCPSRCAVTVAALPVAKPAAGRSPCHFCAHCWLAMGNLEPKAAAGLTPPRNSTEDYRQLTTSQTSSSSRRSA